MLLTAYLYMMNAMQSLRREEGQGLVEYALIIVLIAVLLIVALTALKDQISTAFSRISSGLAITS